jgi:signal transduction histidine kinase
MHVRTFNFFFVIPESEPAGNSTSRKVKLTEFFIFAVLVSVVFFTILFGGFIHTVLVVFFVVILLVTLVRKVRTTQESMPSQKSMYLLHIGTFALCVSLLFSTLWVGYCKIASHHMCIYSTYILCAEVTLLFIMVVVLYRKGVTP